MLIIDNKNMKWALHEIRKFQSTLFGLKETIVAFLNANFRNPGIGP